MALGPRVGRRVLIDSRPCTGIGVMPQTFRCLSEAPEIVLPLPYEPSELTLDRTGDYGVARLPPTATVDQANADVARMLPST